MNRLFLNVLFSTLPLVCGCLPISDNELPEAYLHHEPKIVGTFRFKDEFDPSQNISIAMAGDALNGKYVMREDETANEPMTSPIHVFKLNNTLFASLLETDQQGNSTGQFQLARLHVTEDRIVVEPLNKNWFLAHPGAFPGTLTENTIGETKVRLNGSPETLANFFRDHADSETLFETGIPLVLIRTSVMPPSR